MRSWNPPIEIHREATAKRRVFVFLRKLPHRLFDEEMQTKLMTMYSPGERGKHRVPPAQLALASLLQAALDIPGREPVELTVMDMRWQMVLDCLGTGEPLFSLGTLFNFRRARHRARTRCRSVRAHGSARP